MNRLPRAGIPEDFADPFADSQLLAPGETPDFFHIGIGKQDLEALTHVVSIT